MTFVVVFICHQDELGCAVGIFSGLLESRRHTYCCYRPPDLCNKARLSDLLGTLRASTTSPR